MNPFKKATKQAARLRLALVGPAGSGKTYTALAVGQHLGGKVAVIDTEHGSAAKYADLFTFDVMELTQGVPSATGPRRVTLRLTGWARSRAFPDADAYDKCLLDGLVWAGLLVDDDTRSLIGRVEVHFSRGPRCTEIELEEERGNYA
jgi:hypothetical protein